MNNKYNSIKELSNILYFGSNLKLMELKGKVFLTPYICIASLFIASYYVKSILRYKHNSFSLKYKEWDLSNEQLINPLPNTTIYHNIESLSKFYGTATGFIYFIDITKVNIGNIFKYTTFNAVYGLLLKSEKNIDWPTLFKHGTKEYYECK